jgi:hypothetical protein
MLIAHQQEDVGPLRGRSLQRPQECGRSGSGFQKYATIHASPELSLKAYS